MEINTERLDESLCIRSVGLRRTTRPSQNRRGAAVSARGPAFSARGRGAHLCRTPRRLGADRSAWLRRAWLQRASLLAIRANEFAQLNGRVSGSTHEKRAP